MKTARIFLLLFAVSTTFISCSKTEYFKSESGVKKKLEGDWNLVPIPRTNPDEVWNFHDGTLIRYQANSQGMAPLDTANFTVKTSWVKSEIKINDFTRTLDMLNGAWEIVLLDDEFLIIATDHDGATGIMQREFTKAK